MANYLLKALIDSDTVKFFNVNNQKIVIVKVSGNSSTTDVAWVTFKPFEANTVAWEEIYGLYASYTELQGKATIVKSSYTLASDKNTYPFESGVFSAPTSDPSLSDNTYEIANKMQEYNSLTFGLAQNVVANGISYQGNPINAQSVLPNQTASFTPHERISIFMESDIDNGVVISRVKGTSLDIDFTSKSEITIRYDKSVGGFVEV